jgi:phospholipid/cholesterol/gamma-HCH transport system ATP-binding protein
MSAAAREAVIEVRGLISQFGAQRVHDGVDLALYRGEVLGVIGGSGAGKSVLLRSIVGLKQPDGGTVRLFGDDTTHLDEEARRPYERRFGLLFQDGALFSSLACASARAWRARWLWTPRSCFWTSRPRVSTRSAPPTSMS